MNSFVLNLVLAFLWAGLMGSIDGPQLLFGFVLGYVLLFPLRGLFGRAYHRKLPQTLGIIAFFLAELVRSTLRVAWEVITPATLRRPGIIAVPLDAESDVEITLLANLVSLTPGTISLDVSDDRSVLYVHAMFVEDPEQLCREIKSGFERRILDLLR
jgi:multicomponent Na+:H+ antiporter subunit E